MHPVAANPASPDLIRSNQLGFQPKAAKRAVLVSESRSPLDWSLVTADGSPLAHGRTRVFGVNPGSGEYVHAIDFTNFGTEGTGYRLAVGDARSHPFDVSNDLYSRLKYDALAYFYHNRSGILIDRQYVGSQQWARPAGHVPDSATCFDGKDRFGHLWPGCSYTLDVTGGWYDAGDHGKYVVNGGISVWTLLNYYERTSLPGGAGQEAFGDGKVAIPEYANGISDLLDEARWEIEFLLAMQVPAGAKLQVARNIRRGDRSAPDFTEIDATGLVHHKVHDDKWTPLPTAPHQDRRPRHLYPPTTAATLNLAATAAQCARIWRDIDADFSGKCLKAAEGAYAAAEEHPDLYAFGGFDGGGAYGDFDVSDEFYWAASELFITTGKDKYAKALRVSPHFLTAPTGGDHAARDIGWAAVESMGTLSLALVPNNLPQEETGRAKAAIRAAADRYLAQSAREGYAIPFSGAPYNWGSNSDILNRAIVLGLAFDFTGKAAYRDGVVDAIDYVLGRNPLDQSYVSGYGERPMKNPHHRFWARRKNSAFPPPPPGALSGGPNATNMRDPVARRMKGKCLPQTCWSDHIEAFTQNEVAINWNAPLFWVTAFLDEDQGSGETGQ